MTQKKGAAHIVARVAFWIVVLVILVYTLFPFVWSVLASFKTEDERMQTPTTYLPQTFTLENYAEVFQSGSFLRGLLNSAVVSGGVVLLSLAIGSFTAYALGRLKFRGRR